MLRQRDLMRRREPRPAPIAAAKISAGGSQCRRPIGRAEQGRGGSCRPGGGDARARARRRGRSAARLARWRIRIAFRGADRAREPALLILMLVLALGAPLFGRYDPVARVS